MYDLLCAVASPAWQERLPQETLQTADWERVIHTAEHHGLAPLLYTRLRDTKLEDQRKVFTVHDGLLHISGDGFGGVVTKDAYRDYHLILEFKW